MSGPLRCVVCCFAKSNMVMDRDAHHDEALIFYWKCAGINMKPNEAANYHTCATCFDKIDELHATNQASINTDKKLTTITDGLSRSLHWGIKKRKQMAIPLLKVHLQTQASGKTIHLDSPPTQSTAETRNINFN